MTQRRDRDRVSVAPARALTRVEAGAQIDPEDDAGDVERGLHYRHFSWSSPQILSIGPTMQTGATLVLARKFSQARFFDWVREYAVTVAVGIPTVIKMLLARPAAVEKADLPSLRFMTSSTAPHVSASRTTLPLPAQEIL